MALTLLVEGDDTILVFFSLFQIFDREMGVLDPVRGEFGPTGRKPGLGFENILRHRGTAIIFGWGPGECDGCGRRFFGLWLSRGSRDV